jgi:hypothetical protein
MSLHLPTPTHPSQFAGAHVLRNLLLAIVLATVAVVVVYAAATTDLTPEPATTAPALSQTERFNEFRAGERMPVTMPSAWERFNEFRAGERAN